MPNLLATALNLLNHPVFQSLVLPLVLAVLGMAALLGLQRLLAARRNRSHGNQGNERNQHAGLDWVPAGALLGLLVPMILLTGLNWPALAHTQKLPWIVLAALAVALWAAARGKTNFLATWLAPAVLWLLACFWLAGDQPSVWATSLAGLAGAAVLALIAAGAAGRTGAAATSATAVTAVASFGLALLVANGGSLLLAQLAMMLACSAAVPGLWAWLRPASGLQVPGWLLQLLGLTGLAIGWAWLLSTPDRMAGSAMLLGVLALAFTVPLLLRFFSPRLRWLPLVAALLAAVPAALALGLQIYASSSASSSATDSPASGDAQRSDDPYYTPQWR